MGCLQNEMIPCYLYNTPVCKVGGKQSPPNTDKDNLPHLSYLLPKCHFSFLLIHLGFQSACSLPFDKCTKAVCGIPGNPIETTTIIQVVIAPGAKSSTVRTKNVTSN